MNISVQDSTEELLDFWIKYSTVYKNQRETTEEVRRKRVEIKKILDTKGIVEIEIYGIDDDTYTLRYSYRGNKNYIKLNVQ